MPLLPLLLLPPLCIEQWLPLSYVAAYNNNLGMLTDSKPASDRQADAKLSRCSSQSFLDVLFCRRMTEMSMNLTYTHIFISPLTGSRLLKNKYAQTQLTETHRLERQTDNEPHTLPDMDKSLTKYSLHAELILPIVRTPASLGFVGLSIFTLGPKS